LAFESSGGTLLAGVTPCVVPGFFSSPPAAFGGAGDLRPGVGFRVSRRRPLRVAMAISGRRHEDKRDPIAVQTHDTKGCIQHSPQLMPAWPLGRVDGKSDDKLRAGHIKEHRLCEQLSVNF
jgi:hypothetical protein